MGIEDRPYVGTWKLNNKQVVRHTPDCLVYVNGSLAIPGCLNCNGRIDLQKYITQVSVDPSTQPPATATISMHIPRQVSQTLWRDGDFLLHPGLEIHIYMRGYFPVKGVLSNVPAAQVGVDTSQAMAYPYYHVFHGVVTEVSHEYSGTDHTVSMNCADLLHFWQYIRMSTNAAALASTPKNSKNKMSVVGHNFTSMTPYGIVYSLWRDVFGASGGAEFTISNSNNSAANNTAISDSQYSQTLLYWQKRFGETMANIRMYGVDGSLFNAFQQAYLGKLSDTKQTEQMLSAKFGGKENQDSKEIDPFSIQMEQMIWGQDFPPDGGGKAAGVSAGTMQSFVFDPSAMGVNVYESQYQTKMEIVNTVTELTGFEFYQDVDGDFVFKPPFYNMDSSSSRTYVVKPIDLISFSAREGEPEATVVKCTGSALKNTKIGSGSPLGKRAEFIDYRLVAQYGWRQQTFESEYHGDPRAMYFACINRMDLFNIGVKSASCSIPLRPELRPGMPVYIEHLDCYYYLQAFNHSFSFGGQCTTSMTLVGKRAKFHAPGVPPLTRVANLDDIDLSNPFLPKLPLMVDDNNGIPKYQGFPNVVLALDPSQLNPLFYVVGNVFDFKNGREDQDPTEQIRALLITAISRGVITHNYENAEAVRDAKEAFYNGPFKIQLANGSYSELSQPLLLQQLATVQGAQAEVTSARSAEQVNDQLLTAKLQALEEANGAAVELNTLITAVQSSLAGNFPDADSQGAYLDLLSDLKSSFSPGGSVPGYYRYYSASHPDPEQQGQPDIFATEESGSSTGTTTLLESPERVLGFELAAGEGVVLTDPRNGGGVLVTAGLPVMRIGEKEPRPTPTHQIQTITFAQHRVIRSAIKLGKSGVKQLNFSKSTLGKPSLKCLEKQLAQLTYDATTTVDELFGDFYRERTSTGTYTLATAASDVSVQDRVSIPTLDEALSTLRSGTPNTSDAAIGGEDEEEEDVRQNVLQIARHLTAVLSETASEIMTLALDDLVSVYGYPGQVTKEGTTASAKEEAFCYQEIIWDRIKEALAPGEVINGEGGPPVKAVLSLKVDKPFYSPVFPVSDERGYEVIGSYKYGRGLSIEPGGSFERLLTELSEITFSDLGPSAIEALVTALQNKGDVAKVIGTLDPAKQAEVLALLKIDPGDGSTVQEYLKVDPEGELRSRFNSEFRARLATTQDTTQKQTIVNAAYSLADLQNTLRDDICNCKGGEADILLLAFNADNFVDYGLPDGVSNYISGVARDKQLPHKSAQDAMRGTVLDTNSLGLYDAISGASKAFNGGLFTTTGQALTEQAQALGDVNFEPDEGG